MTLSRTDLTKVQGYVKNLSAVKNPTAKQSSELATYTARAADYSKRLGIATATTDYKPTPGAATASTGVMKSAPGTVKASTGPATASIGKPIAKVTPKPVARTTRPSSSTMRPAPKPVTRSAPRRRGGVDNGPIYTGPTRITGFTDVVGVENHRPPAKSVKRVGIEKNRGRKVTVTKGASSGVGH